MTNQESKLKIKEIIEQENKYMKTLKEKILKLDKKTILEKGFEYHSKYHILCSLAVYSDFEDNRIRNTILELKEKIDPNISLVEEIYDVWMNEESEEFNEGSILDKLEKLI